MVSKLWILAILLGFVERFKTQVGEISVHVYGFDGLAAKPLPVVKRMLTEKRDALLIRNKGYRRRCGFNGKRSRETFIKRTKLFNAMRSSLIDRIS
jgi:lysyl-tRNA synthetase class II